MAGETVSGPGKLSRRTDTGPAQKLRELGDAQYGEAATFRDLQKQAPVAQTPAPKSNPASRPGRSSGTGSPITPLSAPSARPDEPVTAGAAAGAGPGPESLNLPAKGVGEWQSARDMLDALRQTNPDDSSLAYLAARLSGRF